MSIKQLELSDNILPYCPFLQLLENDDFRCLDLDPNQKNEVFSCDKPKTYEIIYEIGDVKFTSTGLKTPKIALPGFIPVLSPGSQNLLKNVQLSHAAVSMNRLISPKQLSLSVDFKKTIGINNNTKLISLFYGKDMLIESIWPKRIDVFGKLKSQDLILTTGINYSVWLSDPHAERIINLKRSLITFEEMAKIGLPCVPHIYWNGHKDIDRWVEWLLRNPRVYIVAINLQTERYRTWKTTIEDIRYFKFMLESVKRGVYFLINGPCMVEKIITLKDILGVFTLTNTYPAQMAWSRRKLEIVKDKITILKSPEPTELLFRNNLQVYNNLMKN